MSDTHSGKEIRNTFIEFFKSKDHKFVRSASLVPGGDKTLLFTNAGMVQFKDVFLGIDKRPYRRAVNSQKCMRVAGKHNDLEDVGRDDSHHTFFEMLGNWSFGDYYKHEAITWAWELLTEVWGMDRDRLWVSCFKDEKQEIPTDEEAAAEWRKQPGLDPAHIVFSGRKENFWEMAETGPCGPCSEIHIDLGPQYCDQKDQPGHICDISHNCKRFLEFWNLVFIQYNRLSPAELVPLPEKHVDTGMGLERLVAILEGKNSNYLTDLFSPILKVIRDLCGQSEIEMQRNFTSYRVIADHGRAATFLIADGVVPGNIGRNYICRMIIRRAARFGSKLGLRDPFLAKVAEVVIENYSEAYPELKKNKSSIFENITREEEHFRDTIEIGLVHLQDELNNLESSGKRILPGEIAFDLYATHGLPFEITRDIAREQNLEVEEAGFTKAMEEHRIQSGSGKSFSGFVGEDADFYNQLRDELLSKGELAEDGVVYDPYSTLSRESKIIAFIHDGKKANRMQKGDRVEVILTATNFYVESGGQVGDSGWITDPGGEWKIQVDATRRPAPGLIVHSGIVVEGSPSIGNQAVAQVDEFRRKSIMRNHTATHLLHAELRKVLGPQVQQAGSLVAPDRLRFDFTYPQNLTAAQLDKIESGVNQVIFNDLTLKIEIKPLNQAIDEGAMALFGEKYADTVRTINIHDGEFDSYELCGGTHVESTGDIGLFIITDEMSVASGIRRIEAVTGLNSYLVFNQQKRILSNLKAKLSATEDEIEDKVDKIIVENKKQDKQIRELLIKEALEEYHSKEVRRYLDQSMVLITKISSTSDDALLKIKDEFSKSYQSGILVVGTIDPSSHTANLHVSVSKDLYVNKGIDAHEIVKKITEILGGGGGGKPTHAKAGGGNPEKLDQALDQISLIIEQKLK